MGKYIGCMACVLLFMSGAALAGNGAKGAQGGAKAHQAKGGSTQVREISGMSIVGNNETPKALVIVPWKSSEIGQETKLKSDLLNDNVAPVDRDVFMRELNFYKLANPK